MNDYVENINTSFSDNPFQQVVKELFNDDSSRCESLIKYVRKAFNGFTYRSISTGDIVLEDVEKWWSQYNNEKLYNFLNHIFFSKNLAPIFCNISIIIKSTAPTLYIPVPYTKAISSIKDFLDCTVLFPDLKESNCDSDEFTDVALKFFHGLSNISFSVRVADSPQAGYLAMAHTLKDNLIYIPDVSKLSDKGASTPINVAQEDQKHIGMASVMYIPVHYNDVLNFEIIEEKSYSPAVLMLWSPIPNYWDIYFDSADEDSYKEWYEMTIESFKTLPYKKIQQSLSWLGQFRTTYDNVARLSAYQFVSFLDVLYKAIIPDSSQFKRTAFKKVLHHYDDIVDFIISDNIRQPTEWIEGSKGIEILFDGNGSVISQFKKNSLITEDKFSSSLLLIDGKMQSKTIMGLENILKIRSSLSFFNFPFSEPVLSRIICDPIHNIKKHAEAISGIDVSITEKYFTIKIHQITKVESLRGVIGNKDSFERYNALRKGLMMPSTKSGDPDNYGIGMGLFHVLGHLTKVYRRLYISPSGEKSWTEIWIPIKRVSYE